MLKVKKLFIPLTLSLFSSFAGFAQNVLQLAPAQPQPGDEINFTYQPQAAVFANSDDVKCTALFYFTSPTIYQSFTGITFMPYPRDITLTKTGNTYKGAFTTDKNTAFVALEFYTTKPNDKGLPVYDKRDINDSIGYPVLFYGRDGKPVQKSNYYNGTYYTMNVLDAKKSAQGIGTADLAAQCFDREMEDYPNAKYYAVKMYSFVVGRTGGTDKFKTFHEDLLEKAFADSLNTPESYDYLTQLLNTLRRYNEAAFIKKLKDEKFPDNPLAVLKNQVKKIKASQQNNPEDYRYRIRLIDTMENLFNQMPAVIQEKAKYNYLPYSQKFEILSDIIQFGSTKEFLNYAEKNHCKVEDMPDLYFNTRSVSKIQAALDSAYEQGNDKQTVLAYVKQLVDFYMQRATTANAGIPISTHGDDNYKAVMPNIQDANVLAFVAALFYADLLHRDNKGKEAFKYLRKSKIYLNKFDKDYFENYCPAYNALYAKIAKGIYSKKKYKNILEEIISTGKYDADAEEALRDIYKDEHPSDQGFDAYVASLKKELYADMQKEFDGQKLNEKASDFSLKDMQGNTVTLADFKGKILVLDFWATWCGPCKASFPAMKELVNEYKDNNEVAFLFVDTGESFKNFEDNKEAVKKIIEGGNYTFHVVLDFDKAMVSSYGIHAFPTKMVIDKNGRIRYQKVGAQLDVVTLKDEIKLMIDSIK